MFFESTAVKTSDFDEIEVHHTEHTTDVVGTKAECFDGTHTEC